MSSSFEDQLRIAITEHNAIKLAEFIELLDDFHRGNTKLIETYPDIGEITDNLYEQAKSAYEEVQGKAVNQFQALSHKKLVETQRVPISDLAMTKDGIIKDSVVNLTSTHICCMPKYDGISCAIRFLWNDSLDSFVIDEAKTRGSDVGVGHKDTNMKNKIQQVLDSDRCSWWPRKFNGFHRLFKQISVRGELVLNNKEIGCPAPYVAGKVNAKSEILDPENVMTYKIFEITRVVTLDGKTLIPGQLKALKYIHALDENFPYVEFDLTEDSESNTKLLLNQFKVWQETLENPIDGVVYTTKDWTYPAYQDETHGVNYGKYALKPNEMSVSQITGIEYTMSKDGKLNPILKFTPTKINGKNYKQAKSAISNLVGFINNSKIGIGSTIDVTLQASIIPQVTRVVNDSAGENKFELPTVCPMCGSALDFKTVKSISTLTCVNLNCKGRVIKRLVNLMKNLKVPGFAEKNLNKLLEEIKYDYSKLFDKIDEKMGNNYMKNTIMNVEVGNLMIGLGIGTKTTIKKLPNVGTVIENKVSHEIINVKKELSGKQDILIKLILDKIDESGDDIDKIVSTEVVEKPKTVRKTRGRKPKNDEN